MKRCILICMAMVFSGMLHGASAKKPNIIFFINDDQIKSQVGCYGGNVLTPHLDRLAREGMRFDNAHAVSTVCTPSRYSMFTGRYPGNSWDKSYLAAYPKDHHGAPGFNMSLEEDNMNVGNVLRQAGYVTGHVGKLHVGPHLKDPAEYEHYGLYDVSKKNGLDEPDNPDVIAGWQRNEKWYRQWIMDRGFSWAKHVYWGNVHGAYPYHNPEWTLEAALEFIELNQDKPFYLHYCTTMMHGGGKGWNTSMEHPLASGAGKLEKLPDVIPSRDEIKKMVDDAGLDQGAYGFTWMDATIGAVLNKLDELGIADNTLFVFIADHGTEGKFTLHDHNGTAVPCIVRWPGVVKPGSVCSNLVQNTDMVPTFFDVAGAAVPEGYNMDGKSIKPILENPKAKVHDDLYFELGYARAVRTDKWKYIAIRYNTDVLEALEGAKPENIPNYLAYQGGAKNAARNTLRREHYLDPDQLYNLEADPEEMNNLAKNPEFRAQLETMRALLTSKLEAQGRPFGEFVPGVDSVPVEAFAPYREKMSQLERTKKGYRVPGTVSSKSKKKSKGKKTTGLESEPESKPKTKAERKAAQAARKKARDARKATK